MVLIQLNVVFDLALCSNAVGSWRFIAISTENSTKIDKRCERFANTAIQPGKDDAVG